MSNPVSVFTVWNLRELPILCWQRPIYAGEIYRAELCDRAAEHFKIESTEIVAVSNSPLLNQEMCFWAPMTREILTRYEAEHLFKPDLELIGHVCDEEHFDVMMGIPDDILTEVLKRGYKMYKNRKTVTGIFKELKEKKLV